MPHTVQTACGSFGDRHCGHATVATGVAFHCARRERVLLRDILRLGTATVLLSLGYGVVVVGLLGHCSWRSAAHRGSA